MTAQIYDDADFPLKEEPADAQQPRRKHRPGAEWIRHIHSQDIIKEILDYCKECETEAARDATLDTLNNIEKELRKIKYTSFTGVMEIIESLRSTAGDEPLP
jgi:tRNA G26 N,N-dimethylase Trm1